MSSANKQSTTDKRVVWRSLEQKADPARLQEEACGSDVVKQTIDTKELFTLRRRNFMTLGGAMATLAGIEGCIRRPVENIMPYADMPEYVNPGVPLHYATVSNRQGEALGLLVTTYEGRPTKIEGNPDHPTSLGAADLLTQASILDLYDTERARSPMLKGTAATFADFDAALAAKLDELGKRGGAGLRVLAQPTNSPTFMRVRDALKRKLSSARVHTYAPINQSTVAAGTKLAFGRGANVLYDFSRAKVVLALDSDFMMTEQGSVLSARQFAMARNMESAAGDMNRLYSVESTLTVTGSNADHRLRLPAQDILRYTKALAAELASAHRMELGPIAGAVQGASADGIPEKWVKQVAADLARNHGAGVIVAGARQPAEVHALVHALNRALGNVGTTVTFAEAVDPSESDNFADIAALVSDMNAGNVDTLVILGGNPAHDAPADLAFAAALAKVGTSIHVSAYDDETAALCTWLVPLAHELETWGDQLSSMGHYSVQQPLIAPLWGGRSPSEIVGQLAGIPNWRGYELVHATAESKDFRGEIAWRELLHKGVSMKPMLAILGASSVDYAGVAAALSKAAEPAALGKDNLEVVFMPDTKFYDGRHANNTWLLEAPDPVTRITWDNAALIAPSTAKALGIKSGDLITLKKGAASITIVAWLQPGVAANSVTLSLGWGRKKAGSNGNGRGFDVYPLRTSTAPHFTSGVTLEKVGKTYPISQTQEHDLMEGRPLAIDATLEQYKEQPNFTEYRSPDPAVGPLWETQDYSQGQQWGMVIDLNTCNGCNACVIACQSENNVPVVGKEQVARGREMHWFRIDRYYVGENEDEPEVAYQPIGCQHCEEAPCENVCPVAATSHSPEGLNDIAYNRCIGTRYCMNNCPYKVRRFNFLNFNLDIPETRQMQFNPNVTVRFRGVIEKCSYCVQRIQTAKISAKREGRRTVRDGDVKSACQQTCPTQAISFGDLNDPESVVSKKRKTDRNYALLAEIGARPRTRFLGKIRNPNPEMKS
jgi:Fe-S-cluster-containing dehydrogenase component/anaerobic selenocysteine-containing dehydrogenase